jgi:hypothetical protein
MKMEQIECSETSAYKIQTPGNHPEENIQHTDITDWHKEGNVLSNIEKVLRSWSECYEEPCNCKKELTMTVEKSRQCAYELQNDILNLQMV